MSERLKAILERLAIKKPLVPDDMMFLADDLAAMAPVVAAALKRRDARRAIAEWRSQIAGRGPIAPTRLRDAMRIAEDAEDAACDAFASGQDQSAPDPREALKEAVVEAAVQWASKAWLDSDYLASVDTLLAAVRAFQEGR